MAARRRSFQRTHLLFVILVLVASGSSPGHSSVSAAAAANHSHAHPDIVAQYSLPATESSYFTHMAFDKKRSVLYAAATNRILQLNKNLSLLGDSKTGPKHDSPSCHAGGCHAEAETEQTNNHNKVLVVSEHNDTLIACGSVRQGACEIYNLNTFPKNPADVGFAVAANDEFASTYAFIGPSKYQSWKREEVLYVGTTFTNVGDYRHDVPAISSRKLKDLEIAEFSIQQTVVNIDVKYRDVFLVDYVYGFNTSEYAYFAVVQKKSYLADESGYITRLARVCVSDPNYDSYTEVTLECIAQGPHGEDVNYNILRDAKVTPAGQKLAQQLRIKRDDLVLVAVFSPSKDITNEPQDKSAMCVYSLEEVETMFYENIHLCFNGSNADRNLDYISGTINNGKCSLESRNIFDFCNVGLKLSGMAPVIGRALFSFDNESVTSVTTAQTGAHNVAFLGTADGFLKKVSISGRDPGEYARIKVDETNQKILPDTMLSPKQDYLYAMSRKRITKIRVEHCNQYTNCSSCLESRDPFCGWCSLEKRCTIRNACQKDQAVSRWLSHFNGQQCIDFEMVQPDKVSLDDMASVHLVISRLPELPMNAKYKCVFGNVTPIEATVVENGLRCPTPPLKLRPGIPAHQDHVLVPLSVRSSETNKDFVSRSFAFFDCGRHDTCRGCVSSQWGCNWCLYDNVCVHNKTTCRTSITNGVIHREDYCPRLKKPTTPILLPVDRRKEIRLEVENLPRPQSGHSGFTCMVTVEGANMGLPAKVENNRFVVCEPTEYTYEARTAEYEATVEVRWNRNHYVDTTSVTLYKCDVLGSHKDHADCSLCVTRDPKYQCTWCGNKCDYNQTCDRARATNECPRPRIDVIKPLAGPIEGGTLITIEGSNLGIREEDVRNKIWIGDVPCELENYEISVRIECRTGRVTHEMAAPVKVGNHAGYTDSPIKFQYKDVRLEGLSPTLGPQSGGTTLSIIGKDLNIGSKITAFLDDYECMINITQASSGRLNCVTSAARGRDKIQTLTLIIDGANRTYPDRSQRPYARPGESIYNYTQDPRIMEIKPLKSFVSGGRMITVHGSNLHAIQKPEIEVYAGEERVNKSTCTVISADQMECPSPSVKGKFDALRRAVLNKTTRKRSVTENLFTTIGYHSSSVPGGYSVATPQQQQQQQALSNSDAPLAALKQETQLSLQIRFVMDNVQTVHDLSKHFPSLRSSLVYVEDPKYQQFPGEEGVKLYKGDTLVIEGEMLNLASDDTDVNVTIGTSVCNRTSLANMQLVCIPPENQPAGTDENGVDTPTDLPLVVVRVGKNLRFPIGYLKYELLKGGYGISTPMIVIMAAIVAVALVLVGVLIVYRRKSTQAEREYKRIQIQMDTLESNVRSECKKAFAELQTDMTDITADLENTGIPTLEHQHYIMKVFFPGVTDHPILNAAVAKMRLNGGAPTTNYDAAMLQFEQLINNKRFLLTFVETLEQQKSFNIRDKVNVASLLMIVLMNKMEYATDILKSLLLRLIEKAVHQKHPQLMLRRTDSVVEKMLTNYMALCMYDYLRDYAGSSLFLLFKAIKHQIEKGLVDAITHDARYSLSDERLLREQIEPEPVTVHIVQDDLDEKIHCKVLDQDTITQVKSKILDALFKSTPYSMRPSVHDIDLEWRHGRGGHLTLQDEDVTTKTINGWRRLNTLAHYGVQQSAVMSLVAKPNDSYGNGGPGQNLLGGAGGNKGPLGQQSYLNCFYITNTQPHMIINSDLDTNGLQPARVFHLVKPVVDESHFSFKSIASNLISGHALSGYQHHHNHPHAGGNGMERTHKAIPEIFLTRLLRTKGTIQKFVDDFFATILTVNEDLPPAVKWLFDLLDDAALRHGIHDPDVVHAWKSNSLPLRFWVNFIKNPDFIFDVEKSPTVDACLSVIAQTFMDSCSTTELRLGKDSPSNKLLFAKDIPSYRDMVRVFYNDVARLPQVSDQEMGTAMQELSVQQVDEFDVIAALKELYIYVTKYREPLLDNLEMDTGCKKQHLAQKLDNVACTLQGFSTLQRPH